MKYADHLPLTRQATQIFKRAGIDFSESSMCRWMRVVVDHLEPLYDLIHSLICQSFFVRIDASWAKYRSIMTKGRCKQGYIWGFLGDNDYPYVWYGFETNGSREGPARILGDYSGCVQCNARRRGPEQSGCPQATADRGKTAGLMRATSFTMRKKSRRKRQKGSK